MQKVVSRGFHTNKLDEVEEWCNSQVEKGFIISDISTCYSYGNYMVTTLLLLGLCNE